MERKFISNPSYEEIPTTADVVIIGGGMAGPAAAWALESHSPGINTVLLEKKSQLAAGANLASIENFRTAWPTECIAQMMLRSADIFLHADDYLGEGASEALNVQQRGYLYCGFNEEDSQNLKESVDQLHSIGLDHVEFLDEAEVAHRYPWLKGRIVAAKFDPVAGWLDSNALAYSYAHSTSEGKVLFDIQETKIIVEKDRVVGVSTPNGFISTPNVVIAAGSGSRQVGMAAGIDIPIVVRPRQSFTSPWRHADFPADSPFVIGAHPSSYVRPEAQSGAIFGWEYHIHTGTRVEGTEDYLNLPEWPIDKYKDRRFPSMTLKNLADQFNYKDGEGFADTRYLKGVDHRVGYYVYRDPKNTFTRQTPQDEWKRSDSERAIIDAYPEIDGLFLSVAHVGHGIMSSPAAAEILAAYVLGKELSDPLFYQFKLNVTHVENDGGGL